MRNIKKILISGILVVLIILESIYNLNAYAKTNDKYNKDNNIESQIELYNENNDIVAYYFKFSEGGYVITNSDGSEVIEYSFDRQKRYLESSKKYYYSGPCSIYKKVGNINIENVSTSEEATLDDVEFEIETEVKNNKLQAISMANDIMELSAESGIYDEQCKLPHSTKKYSYNPDGRCGAVASAIMFRYYDDFVDSRFVRGDEKTANGVKLIDILVNTYLGTSTTYHGMERGLNRYLDDRNIRSRVEKVESAGCFSKIKSRIKYGRPVIVGLTGHPRYSEHWVVGTGYSVISPGTGSKIYTVEVNDGWGNINVKINKMYIDGCIYVN